MFDISTDLHKSATFILLNLVEELYYQNRDTTKLEILYIIIIINTDLQHMHVYIYAGEYWGL